MTRDTPTADDLRRVMEAPDADGKHLNTDGVLAQETAKHQIPDGWEAPRILPPNWREVDRSPDGTVCYQSFHVRVILSASIELDGRAWLHLSISTKTRIPNWQEIAHAKNVFLGDREAYQVIPPKARYVNINERVLHVFALLDETATALPDFTHATGSL